MNQIRFKVGMPFPQIRSRMAWRHPSINRDTALPVTHARTIPATRLARLLFTFVMIAIIGSAMAGRAAAIDDIDELRAKEAQLQATLEKVSPCVVAVNDGIGAGSGVIVSADGLVLTAGHVLLTDRQELAVTLWDGTTVAAKPLGRNLNIDAGMIQITEEGDYPFVELGDTESIAQGDWCIAMGHPGGYQLGRTPPVRVGRVLEIFDWMLLTDCTLTGGDSGGPIFDLDGRLIGINSSIGQSIAENRHSRIDGFVTSWERMATGESWGRLGGVGPPDRDSAYLGVHLDLDSDNAVVVKVLEGSPAEEAGLQEGDVILSINDESVASSQEVIAHVADGKAGEEFTIRVMRDGRRVRIRGRLGRYDESD